MTMLLERPIKNTIWSSRVRGPEGELKHIADFNLNIRPNAGNNWQDRVMFGDGVPASAVSLTATATSATSFTAAGLTTANIDHILAAGPNSAGAGSVTYGVITAVAAGVATVDKWYVHATPGGTAATTPNATATGQVLPGAAPMVWMALSSTVQSGAATDTALAGELSTNGFSRTYWTTYTHSANSTATSLAKTFTATGTSTINSEALFNASANGTMGFESAETSPPTLVSGDTLAQTVTCNY